MHVWKGEKCKLKPPQAWSWSKQNQGTPQEYTTHVVTMEMGGEKNLTSIFPTTPEVGTTLFLWRRRILYNTGAYNILIQYNLIHMLSYLISIAIVRLPRYGDPAKQTVCQGRSRSQVAEFHRFRPCRTLALSKAAETKGGQPMGFQQAIFDYHDQRGQFCSRIFNVEWFLLLDVRMEGVAGVLPEKQG